jgi:hypothetical protein
VTIPTNRTALSNNATTVLRMRHYPTEHVEQKQIEKSPWGGRKGKSCRVYAMAATSGPRWRRRSGRTEVGECPKLVRRVTGLPPSMLYEYIGHGCVSNWAAGVGASYVNV